MFRRLFGRERQANRAITDALYSRIVAAARQPAFYSDWHVPDTPLGRFEMISLHMFLLQHRLHGETGPSREIAQDLVDEFFAEVEQSLRELGIGDVGVPKRMKKLARMFYGRTAAYADALAQGDGKGLAEALRRNVRPDVTSWAEAGALAGYVTRAWALLASQASDDIRAGTLRFPTAGEGGPNAA